MLVPSMTLQEIRREINLEKPIVFRKVQFLIHDFMRAKKPHGKDVFVRHYDYVSKYKNKWLFRIGINRHQAELSYLVYYYNDIGLVGILVFDDDDELMYLTSHLFKRFNERLRLNLTTPREIMVKFLDEFPGFNGKRIETIEPGVYKMFYGSTAGYFLGINNMNLKFIKMNTFITHDMLKGEQHETADILRKEIAKYVPDAFKMNG